MEKDEDDGCSVATSDFIKIGQSADEQGGQEGGESSHDGRHINTADSGFSDIDNCIGGYGNTQQLKWQIEALKTKNQMLEEKLRNLELEQKCAKLEQKMRDQSMERKLENGQKRMEEIAKDMAMLKKAQQKEIPEWKYPQTWGQSLPWTKPRGAWGGEPLPLNWTKPRSLFAPDNKDGEDEEEEGEPEEFTPDACFEPLIELPPKIEVITGEENEETIFVARCKLYRYDRELKENKERGQGDIKILKNPITQKYRCVMRREKVLKLCANFPIVGDLNIQQREHVRNVYTWACKDFSENLPDGEDVTFSVRFKDASIASEFNEKIKEAVEATKQWQAGLMKEGIQPIDNC